MANFKEIDEVRRTLGLGETASLKEIKQAYRSMAFLYHPDKARTDPKSEERMKKLNMAYQILMHYCACFLYTFREEDVARAYPEEEYMRRWRDYSP
jgi:pantothenate kinase